MQFVKEHSNTELFYSLKDCHKTTNRGAKWNLEGFHSQRNTASFQHFNSRRAT